MRDSVRPLTLDDAEALRRVPYATASVPVVQGNAEVEGNGRKRRVTVYGTGHEFADAFRFEVAMGRYLPPDDPRAPRSFAVLGSKMARRSSATRTRSARASASAASAIA